MLEVGMAYCFWLVVSLYVRHTFSNFESRHATTALIFHIWTAYEDLRKQRFRGMSAIVTEFGNLCLYDKFLARLHEVHRAIAVTPVVHVPVPVPVRVPVRVRVTLALKFSRSPYLDNHSSESIHTWTIDTL